MYKAGEKLFFALGIFVCALLGTFAPRLFRANAAYYAYGNMLAAGVLLSSGLVHQLSASVDVFAKQEPKTKFPWPMFMCGCSFVGFV